MDRHAGHDPLKARRYSLRKDGPALQLSRHFRLIEFASRDGADTVIVHPALLDLLEDIRDRTGPIHVNSGYRSMGHNLAVGGVPNSYHTKGMAADITAKTHTPRELARLADMLGAGGVGLYRGFTHVDVGASRRRWRK